MITLIKSLSHNKDQEDQPARPPPSPSVQLPPHVKASVRELQDLSVFSDTGNGLASHQLATPKRDPHTLVIIDTDAAIMQCFATLKELRPHLEREGFVEQVKQQQHEGYRYRQAMLVYVSLFIFTHTCACLWLEFGFSSRNAR